MENEAVNTVEEIEDEQENQPEAESPEERREREAREKKEAQARVFQARKRKLIPPFVMLLAGATVSITLRIEHYDTKSMLIILLCALIGFYVVGCIYKGMLDRFEHQLEEADMEEGEVIEKELAEEGKG